MAADKDTIYIDIDDEITGIIDKVKGSSSKVVALVLPKRAAVFQSIVNMKLLKRAADSSKKNIVLITTENGLLPLAGAAGVHVAKTLNSKPVIPIGPDLTESDSEVDEDDELLSDAEAEELDKNAPIGALAGTAAGAAAIAKVASDEVETVALDNEELPGEAATKAGAKGAKSTPKKDKKLKVPDFDRFRLLLIGGGLFLILLLVGLVFANKVLPKATIAIKTDSTIVDVSFDVNLSTDAKDLDTETSTVPAVLASTQKTYTQQAPATGQKNNGNKASGTVALRNCSKSEGDIVVPAGTGLSSGGNTYISTQAVSLPESSFNGSGKCTTVNKPNVSVLAQNGGSSYNIGSGAEFTVAGFSGVTGTGSAMTGGTDNIVKVVSQNDIESAKSKITVNDAELKQTLKDQLKKDDLTGIEATYSAGTPAVTASAKVGDVADNVTVTQNVTYTMFGVKQADIETLLDNAIDEQIDTKKQNILDNGYDSIVYNVTTIDAKGAKLAASSTASTGPELNIALIKKAAAGKKPATVKQALERNPDVTSVEVKLSPFWVTSVPSNESKINVVIAKPTESKSNSSDAN